MGRDLVGDENARHDQGQGAVADPPQNNQHHRRRGEAFGYIPRGHVNGKTGLIADLIKTLRDHGPLPAFGPMLPIKTKQIVNGAFFPKECHSRPCPIDRICLYALLGP